jgi:hypothetical protein
MRFASFVMGFGKKAEGRKYAFNEIIKLYESKGNKKLSRVGYWKALKNCERRGIVELTRQEQLWVRFFCFPSDEILTDINRSDCIVRTKPLHTTHKIKLSIPYHGPQPKEGATRISPFGRTKTQVQVVYRVSPSITITAFKRKLNVWVHRPPGNSTPEQLINAKAEGYRALLIFAKEHNLRLEGYLNRVLRSHHVLEDKQLNEALKPIFEPNEREIYERIGSHICRTSHPGKIEHEGVRRPDGSIVQGSDVARNVEYLFTRFPGDFAELAKANAEFRENLKTHLNVMEEISKTLKMIREEMRKGKR